VNDDGRRTWQWIAASLVSTLLSLPALSGGVPGSILEPDVMQTESALDKRTHGLKDPLPAMRDPLDEICSQPDAHLSLSDAIDIALCRDPSTRSAWAQAHQQAAALGAAQAAWLPQVQVTGQAQRFYGDHTDATGQTVSSPENSADAAVQLSWTLYDFGARDGKIRSQRYLLDAATSTINSVTQQAILMVVQGYYGSAAADGSLEAARATEEVAERSLEIARALSNGGAGTLADVLQAQTAHDQAVLARVQASAAASTAHGTLAIALGFPANKSIRIDPQPVPAEVPALTARMSDLMAEAQRQRPDLASAFAQSQSARANIQVARAAGLPTISLVGGHQFAYTQDTPNQNFTTVGVNVSIPIFTGFSTTYGVRQAKAAYEASEAAFEQAQLNVSQGVWNAYYALDSAIQQLPVTSELLQTSQQNQEVSLGRYQAGVGTIVDVLTAQTAASVARQTRVTSELNWQTARAELALALGRLTSAQPLATSLP
jgi:outer membrane protein